VLTKVSIRQITDKEFTFPVKAIWNGAVLAESNETIVVENNHYFPPQSVRLDYFQDSSTHTTCPWKGEASYYTIAVDGQENPDAAWYYPHPKDAARQITGYIAFWHGVQVEGEPAQA
jgi:uncharacterized protein (DUF427 family)